MSRILSIRGLGKDVCPLHAGIHSPGQTPPPRWPLQWTVRILFECILVLFIPTYLQFSSLFVHCDSKCESRCQWIKRIIFHSCMFHWSSSFLMAPQKSKLAILVFMYCGKFVKNSGENSESSLGASAMPTTI